MKNGKELKRLDELSELNGKKGGARTRCCAGYSEQARAREALEWDWGKLLEETERVAERAVARARWRGRYGGVMPDGFDAKSVAAEAVLELWCGLVPSKRLQELNSLNELNGKARLSRKSRRARTRRVDWASVSSDYAGAAKELRRLAFNLVNRLRRRAENWATQSQWEWVEGEEGREWQNRIERMEGREPRPDELLLEREREGLAAIRDGLAKR